MKSLPCLVLAASLAACIHDPDDSEVPELHTLAVDAHYVAVPYGYATPEDCLASEQQQFSCQYSLSLCASGRAGVRWGDLVSAGTYDMHDTIAEITFDDGRSPMSFDAQAAIDLGSPQLPWIVDTERRWETLQFDNIDCSRPY